MTARYDAVGDWYHEWVCELTDDPAMAAVLALADECVGRKGIGPRLRRRPSGASPC